MGINSEIQKEEDVKERIGRCECTVIKEGKNKESLCDRLGKNTGMQQIKVTTERRRKEEDFREISLGNRSLGG